MGRWDGSGTENFLCVETTRGADATRGTPTASVPGSAAAAAAAERTVGDGTATGLWEVGTGGDHSCEMPDQRASNGLETNLRTISPGLL